MNNIYSLTEEKVSNPKYAEYEAPFSISYKTTSIVKGELVITHHDYDKAIISGTFWFDAVNNAGEKV
ncbi:DUF6252 family protein, partial [Tenacibaculum maritimum]|uniref:DUF6252 family protein n=1 Tax=Tenacibaculum maritimum TaxID=107401 RepID=UPI003742011F